MEELLFSMEKLTRAIKIDIIVNFIEIFWKNIGLLFAIIVIYNISNLFYKFCILWNINLEYIKYTLYSY